MLTKEERQTHQVKIDSLVYALRHFILQLIESFGWDMSKPHDRLMKNLVAALSAQLYQLTHFQHPNSLQEDYERMYSQTNKIIESVRSIMYDPPSEAEMNGK